jgi:hypothetical protein
MGRLLNGQPYLLVSPKWRGMPFFPFFRDWVGFRVWGVNEIGRLGQTYLLASPKWKRMPSFSFLGFK